MLCEPTVRPAVAKLAFPPPFKVSVPIRDAPSKKLIVPVGLSEDPTTSALTLNVTESPELDGLSDEVKEVAVARLPIWSVPLEPSTLLE
jgi:hypothetical protein